MDELIKYIMSAMGLNYQAATVVAQAMSQGAIPFAPPTAATNSANAPTIMRALANPDKGTMTSPQRHLMPGLNGMENDILIKHLMGSYNMSPELAHTVSKDMLLSQAPSAVAIKAEAGINPHGTLMPTVGDLTSNMASKGKEVQDLSNSYTGQRELENRQDPVLSNFRKAQSEDNDRKWREKEATLPGDDYSNLDLSSYLEHEPKNAKGPK
jgi:hypothetical protein